MAEIYYSPPNPGVTTAEMPEPHARACEAKDRFLDDLRKRRDDAWNALEKLEEERKITMGNFEMREQAIRVVLAATDAALEHDDRQQDVKVHYSDILQRVRPSEGPRY